MADNTWIRARAEADLRVVESSSSRSLRSRRLGVAPGASLSRKPYLLIGVIATARAPTSRHEFRSPSAPRTRPAMFQILLTPGARCTGARDIDRALTRPHGATVERGNNLLGSALFAAWARSGRFNAPRAPAPPGRPAVRGFETGRGRVRGVETVIETRDADVRCRAWLSHRW